MSSLRNPLFLFRSTWLLLVLIFAQRSVAAAPLTKGPYLLPPQGASITIRWELAQKDETAVAYGLPGKTLTMQKAILRAVKDGAYLYEATLTSLKPGCTYQYQVRVDGLPAATYSLQVPSPQIVRCDFVAMGDSRSNPKIFREALALTKKKSAELIISMGDLVAHGGNVEEWQRFFFQPAESLIACIPHASTLGDHEGEGDDGELFRHYFMTDQPVDAQWFSFDWGPAHFVSLDYRCPDNVAMIDWFKQDMAMSRAKWKFVYMHRPCYNFGGHRSFWGGTLWQQLFRTFQVDVVLAGHSHQYERFFPTRPVVQTESWPVTYITTGGAGAGLYDVIAHPFLAVAASEHHIVAVHINRDTLRLETLRPNGSQLDRMKIIKHNGHYDQEYLAKVIPQEQINILNTFAESLSFNMTGIPQSYRPYRQQFKLASVTDQTEPIRFEVRLVSESAKYYRMATVSDTLTSLKGCVHYLDIYSRGDMTISDWGDITPILQLEALITSPFGSDRITGAPLGYWP